GVRNCVTTDVRLTAMAFSPLRSRGGVCCLATDPPFGKCSRVAASCRFQERNWPTCLGPTFGRHLSSTAEVVQLSSYKRREKRGCSQLGPRSNVQSGTHAMRNSKGSSMQESQPDCHFQSLRVIRPAAPNRRRPGLRWRPLAALGLILPEHDRR